MESYRTASSHHCEAWNPRTRRAPVSHPAQWMSHNPTHVCCTLQGCCWTVVCSFPRSPITVFIGNTYTLYRTWKQTSSQWGCLSDCLQLVPVWSPDRHYLVLKSLPRQLNVSLRLPDPRSWWWGGPCLGMVQTGKKHYLSHNATHAPIWWQMRKGHMLGSWRPCLNFWKASWCQHWRSSAWVPGEPPCIGNMHSMKILPSVRWRFAAEGLTQHRTIWYVHLSNP